MTVYLQSVYSRRRMSVDEAEEKVRASLKLGGYLLSVVTAHCTFTYFFRKHTVIAFLSLPFRICLLYYTLVCAFQVPRVSDPTHTLVRAIF